MRDKKSRKRSDSLVAEPAVAPRAASLPFLMATTLMTGAGVIMLEVLGARIAGPIFGVSLYIWTALITVTLVSLALGYWLGGRAADRWPSADVLFGLIAVAGLMISVIPLVDASVLVGCYEAFGGEWGVRLGVLAGASPVAAAADPPLSRLSLAAPRHEANRARRDALRDSSVGSVLGTSPLFFLIPAGEGTVFGEHGVACPAFSPPYAAEPCWRRSAYAAAAPSPAAGTLQMSREGLYAQIKVLDRNVFGQTHRLLLLDGTDQTEVVLGTHELVSEYTQVIERFLAVHPPRGRRALLVGLGGGAMIQPLKARGFAIDVVELDPAIVETARDYFLHPIFSYPADPRLHPRRKDLHASAPSSPARTCPLSRSFVSPYPARRRCGLYTSLSSRRQPDSASSTTRRSLAQFSFRAPTHRLPPIS